MTSWYPVALAAGLAPGTSAGTRLFGRELVVWRDEAGQSHVWEDRCPHRGMRLSFGFVRGDHLACLYHGWQFGADGRCRHIPAHPDLNVPGTIRAVPEPTVERLGMVWTLARGSASVDAPPDATVVPVRSLSVRSPAARATEALLAAPPLFDAASSQAEPVGYGIILRADQHRVLAAVQPVSDAESTIHLAILGTPAIYRGDGQIAVSGWAEALRRTVEAA